MTSSVRLQSLDFNSKHFASLSLLDTAMSVDGVLLFERKLRAAIRNGRAGKVRRYCKNGEVA